MESDEAPELGGRWGEASECTEAPGLQDTCATASVTSTRTPGQGPSSWGGVGRGARPAEMCSDALLQSDILAKMPFFKLSFFKRNVKVNLSLGFSLCDGFKGDIQCKGDKQAGRSRGGGRTTLL